MKPGNYLNLSNEDYHRDKAIGSTQIRAAMKSMAHFDLSRKESKEWKSCFDFGTAVHYALLQPDEFKNNVVRGPEGITRASKEWKECVKANPGKIILKPKTTATEPGYDNIQKIQFNFYERESMRQNNFLGNGIPEVSFFWIDKETGLECKCRTDWLDEDGIITDIKTCVEGKAKDAETFTRHCVDFGYHIQAAMYLEGVNMVEGGKSYEDFWIIACEKKEPFLVNEFHVSPLMLEIGHRIFHTQLHRIKEYWDSQSYSGYSIDAVDEHGIVLQGKEIESDWLIKNYLNGWIKEIDYGRFKIN